MSPWDGPRHRSWASDTVLSTVGFVVIFVTYIAWEVVSEAPAGLVTLLGVAGGAWFGAVSGDKRKRDVEVSRKVDRLEVDRVEREQQAHPDDDADDGKTP